ncbi:MAG: DUF4381 family protein [Candidatus Omnitrophica bacterium]|nr:DUF4381 family protein [Candidatus Omnitrophota bacterium]
MNATLHDIRGPLPIPGDWGWIFLCTLLLLLAGLVFFLWRRMQKSKPVVLPPLRPAWEVALERLLRLEQRGRWGEGEIKEFYVELSQVVRLYIEARFEIRAPEMTTEEFMARAVAAAVMTAEHKGFLKDFLNESDMVKFAKFIPGEAEAKRALKAARDFVEQTK